MKYRIDHDLHIHTLLSACSKDPEQSPAAILQHAQSYGLSTVCVTDHYWDSAVPGASDWYAPQDFAHISQSLPLPTADGVSFLFGCEAEMNKFGTLSIPSERFDDFDFIILPTTHLHMKNLTIDLSDVENDARRAELWVSRLDHLLDLDLPFHKIGVAHLACTLIKKGDRLTVLDLIPSSEMERLFTKAAARGCGIELNSSDFKFDDADTERVIRPFRIAKACGCKFYLGSDAHHPAALSASIERFERAIDLLGLTEDDKFHVAALGGKRK